MIVQKDGNYSIRFRTKMGYENEVAKKVENFIYQNEMFKFIDEKPEKSSEKCKLLNYVMFSNHWLLQNFTPIFEFVSPLNQIILSYKETRLICLALRNNLTGEYIPYETLINECKKFNIHAVRSYNLGSDIDKALQVISKMKEVEGFVLRMETDDMYKCKCDWYRNCHSSVPRSMMFGNVNETRIWEIVLDNELDDLTSTLDKNDHKRVQLELFGEELWKHINERSQEILNIHQMKSGKRKEKLEKELNKIEKKVYDFILMGEDHVIAYINVLKKEIKEKIPEEVKEELNIDIKDVFKKETTGAKKKKKKKMKSLSNPLSEELRKNEKKILQEMKEKEKVEKKQEIFLKKEKKEEKVESKTGFQINFKI